MAHGRRLMWLLAMGLSASATALEVTVYGPQQKPLADAVVAVYPETDTPRRAQGARPAATMDQQDRQFVPHVIAVQTGTEVTFPNSDDIRHHVYSFSPAKRFELRLYHGSTADPVMFDEPGKVVLGCNIHDSMLGYIFVVDTAYHRVTAQHGRAQFDLPEGNYRIEVQHPRAAKPTTRQIDTAQQPALDINLGPLAPDLRRQGEKSELEALFDS